MRMNLKHGTTEMRLASVGAHAHGLVLWHDALILLDSEGSALVAIHPPSSTPDIIWRVSVAEAQRARLQAGEGTSAKLLMTCLRLRVDFASCSGVLGLKLPPVSYPASDQPSLRLKQNVPLHAAAG